MLFSRPIFLSWYVTRKLGKLPECMINYFELFLSIYFYLRVCNDIYSTPVCRDSIGALV